MISLDLLMTQVSARAWRSIKIDYLFNYDPVTRNDSTQFQEGKVVVD